MNTTDNVLTFRNVGALLVALAILPHVIVEAGTTYQARLLVSFLVFAILAVALNVVFGHTDQLFLFVGALTGVGAYTTALSADALGVTPWMLLPAGALAAGLIGLLVSYVSARRGMTVIVIAILTLSLQLAFHEFFIGARDITGGSTGFSFSGLEITELTEVLGLHRYVALYYVLLALLGAVLVLYRLLMGSKYGLAFTAIRQDEVAAESVGIDVVRYKTVAGFVGAAIIGLVGPLYAQSELWIEPSMFAFDQVDVLVLIMLVLGGIRTMYGPVVGAAAIVYLNERLHAAGQWRTAIFGALLIGLFLFFRQGIVPAARGVWNGDAQSTASALLDRASTFVGRVR